MGLIYRPLGFFEIDSSVELGPGTRPVSDLGIIFPLPRTDDAESAGSGSLCWPRAASRNVYPVLIAAGSEIGISAEAGKTCAGHGQDGFIWCFNPR